MKGQLLKLLQLLSRVRKHGNRRGRIRSEAAREVVGCESVLEKRVLLSAVSSDFEPVVQPDVEVEGSPLTNGPMAFVFSAASPSDDEVKLEADDLTVPVDSGPAGDDAYADRETGATSAEAAGPVFNINTMAAASADSLRFDRDFAEVIDDVLAGLDVVTAIPADADAVFRYRGPDPLIEALPPLIQGEQPSRASANDFPGHDLIIESEVAEAIEPTESNDDQPMELSRNDQTAERSTYGSVQAQRQLLGFQNVESGRVFHSAVDLRYRHVDSVRSAWLNSTSEERSASDFRFGHQSVVSSALGANSGQPFESLRASQAAWAGLSGLSFSKQAQHRFDFTSVAANIFPAWLARLESMNEGLHPTEFGPASGDVRGFVEVAEPTSQDSFDQPTKLAFIRIEAEIAALSADAAASDDPPKRSDLPEVWQSLRFDCNPRGPPGEDDLLVSEFTRQTGDGKQLQQLRFSIAPRGPSVAFCS